MKYFTPAICAAALFCVGTAYAMPSQKEMAEVQPLVNELMKPSVAAYKAKRISGSEVGDKALELAEAASTEAAVFLCMKGALTYYVRDKDYDKAADAIEAIMAKFPDMPPETLHEITTSATKGASAKSSQRLCEIHRMAAKRATNTKKLRTLRVQLKKTPADKNLIRRYAELTAVNGDWGEALENFAKLSGDIGKMAQDELNGNASAASLADFWWNYLVLEDDTKDVMRQRAAMHYQSAIDKGELEGLKLVLAEKRIAEVALDNPQVQSESLSNKFKMGLVGYWQFDGNANDSSGNRNHGIMHGVVPADDRFGRTSKALHFNRSNYVEIPNSPTLQNIKNSITMTAWVRPTAWDGDHMIIMEKGNQNDVQFGLYSFRGKFYCYATTEGSERWVSTAPDGWFLNEWQHIAITYKTGQNLRAYRNGKLTGVGSADWAFHSKTLPLIIGCDPWICAEYFIGDMDDVRIYNRALSEQEIEEIYKAEHP